MPECISRESKEKRKELIDKFQNKFLELMTRMLPYTLKVQFVSIRKVKEMDTIMTLFPKDEEISWRELEKNTLKLKRNGNKINSRIA